MKGDYSTILEEMKSYQIMDADGNVMELEDIMDEISDALFEQLDSAFDDIENCTENEAVMYMVLGMVLFNALKEETKNDLIETFSNV